MASDILPLHFGSYAILAQASNTASSPRPEIHYLTDEDGAIQPTPALRISSPRWAF